MCVIAVYALNVFHPSFLFKQSHVVVSRIYSRGIDFNTQER